MDLEGDGHGLIKVYPGIVLEWQESHQKTSDRKIGAQKFEPATSVYESRAKPVGETSRNCGINFPTISGY
jgi:hypothetical protein